VTTRARTAGTRAHDEVVAAWVASELAKPAAAKQLTREQDRLIGSVLANHKATKAKAG
jgi:hypothetical protein